jgi:hypothetical protein
MAKCKMARWRNSEFVKTALSLLFLLCFAVLPKIALSQTDYEFWFAAPAVTHEFVSPAPFQRQNLNHPIRLYLTTSGAPATVLIDQPANLSFDPIKVTVYNTNAKVVDLTPFIDSIENTPSNTVLNRGLHILSNRPISASYEVVSPFNAETWALFGRNALGYEFIVPAQNHYNNYEYANPPARNSFEIVAIEDSTVVRILPKQEIEGHVANDTFSILINKGQTWSGRAVYGDSTKHLGGTSCFPTSQLPSACAMMRCMSQARMQVRSMLPDASLSPAIFWEPNTCLAVNKET